VDHNKTRFGEFTHSNSVGFSVLYKILYSYFEFSHILVKVKHDEYLALMNE
jgi:hypothetical protein